MSRSDQLQQPNNPTNPGERELPRFDIIATRQLELNLHFLSGWIDGAEYKRRSAALTDLRRAT